MGESLTVSGIAILLGLATIVTFAACAEPETRRKGRLHLIGSLLAWVAIWAMRNW